MLGKKKNSNRNEDCFDELNSRLDMSRERMKEVGYMLIKIPKTEKSVPFSSVAQSCPTVCDPMNRSSQASLSIPNSRSLPKLVFPRCPD